MLTLDRAPAGRAAFWADALFAAVAALQDQLSHDDPEVVREAAVAILDLEKTRLRHDRGLFGTAECTPHSPSAVGSEPHSESAEYILDEESPAERSRREHREFIEQLRTALQAKEDEFRSGKVVSVEEAEAYYRQVHDRVGNGFGPRAPDGGRDPTRPVPHITTYNP